MRSIDPWLIAIGFALSVLCVATIVLVVVGPEAALVIVMAMPPTLYALATLVRALTGSGGA